MVFVFVILIDNLFELVCLLVYFSLQEIWRTYVSVCFRMMTMLHAHNVGWRLANVTWILRTPAISVGYGHPNNGETEELKMGSIWRLVRPLQHPVRQPCRWQGQANWNPLFLLVRNWELRTRPVSFKELGRSLVQSRQCSLLKDTAPCRTSPARRIQHPCLTLGTRHPRLRHVCT